jgi:hypothetical protein
MEVHLHAVLTLALDGGEWSASRPGRFTPKERVPWYPLDRRLGGSQSRNSNGNLSKSRPHLMLPSEEGLKFLWYVSNLVSFPLWWGTMGQKYGPLWKPEFPQVIIIQTYTRGHWQSNTQRIWSSVVIAGWHTRGELWAKITGCKTVCLPLQHYTICSNKTHLIWNNEIWSIHTGLKKYYTLP